MPNWCSNALIVTGTPKQLESFRATMEKPDAYGKSSAFSFHQTVPMPQEVFRGDLPQGAPKPNWYDWSTENWGTKWDACRPRVKHLKKSIKVWFDTAWAPPKNWLEQVTQVFPELNFELAYNEHGMEYYGVTVASDGKVTDTLYKKYDAGDCVFNEETEEYDLSDTLKAHIKHYKLGMGG